ncbi:MAG: PHP domain-containing protein [Candidatus Acidiferrales bacterium]
MIDLHTHSTASDGTLTPEALVDLAAEKSLTAIALTDHDTVAGIEPATARGQLKGVHVVPGLEISVRSLAGAMHILGYYVRVEDLKLQTHLAAWCAARQERAQRMVARLNELGYGISYASVQARAGSDSIGRPHVARALMETGAVRSVAEAFERYLRRGRPAFVPREMPEPKEGIGAIKAAGGVAVLAHPSTLGLKGEELAALVKDLKDCGLDGMEVHWSGHSASQRAVFAQLAQHLSLLETGGSDFHGDNKPGIQLGTGRRGNVRVPDSVLEKLRECAAVQAA